ncbi:hypothetical protein [Paraburkholderia rhynchosiae]|uniref:hypothetical protein n=1 Tax=Paraburkholderia rhynchosiae TaxID=487049 RepID=UPI001FD43E63|nr:hypothetical protein [Paraburkholderia rhynchosiae]
MSTTYSACAAAKSWAAISTLAPPSTGNQAAAAVGLRHRFQASTQCLQRGRTDSRSR